MAASSSRGFHPGDSTRRVDAPLPTSLLGLTKKAEESFGHKGRLKLYHKGRGLPITNELQIRRIKDDDVVVCTWDDRSAGPDDFLRLTSTQRESYVAPGGPIAPQKPFAPKDSPPLPLPFTGNSDYRINYIEKKTNFPPNAGLPRPRSEATFKKYAEPFPPDSTYIATYLPHDTPKPVRQKDPSYRYQFPVKPRPFEAESAYGQDFRIPSTRPPKSVNGPPEREKWPHPKVPFDGTSTYRDAYVKWPFEKKPEPKPRKMPGGSTPKKPPPPDGSLEYSDKFGRWSFSNLREPPRPKRRWEYEREYLKKEPTALIHLEPEVGKRN